jgi:squalene/oxidosqualene cyclase-like protein
MQALHSAADVAPDVDTARTLRRAYQYLQANQILEDPPQNQRYYRHRARGGWPFSDRQHGWPITDCTSEGLKAALIPIDHGLGVPIHLDLLRSAVDLILSWQNDDGGWATYERTRGPRWLERLNPSQVFDDIMVDYSYVECTSACLQALVSARENFGDLPGTQASIERGGRFLLRNQRPDGSFEGSWGVCFTYGTWFGVTGLLAAGLAPDDAPVRRACDFLLSIQRRDGSWGEAPRSCPDRTYVPHEDGQVVMTSWALLALCKGGYAAHPATARAVCFLADRQQPDGGYADESYAGVFSRTVMINYDNYRRYFPIWALATWLQAEPDVGR